jgi:hypothetical protein
MAYKKKFAKHHTHIIHEKSFVIDGGVVAVVIAGFCTSVVMSAHQSTE